MRQVLLVNKVVLSCISERKRVICSYLVDIGYNWSELAECFGQGGGQIDQIAVLPTISRNAQSDWKNR